MKLSIITINYNNLAGLRRTIDSVLAQTWHDFEWIVIDGGSTDGSRELIEQYQEHFAYWCSEKDRGVYHAQNKGIEHAQGEYLNFMNSGDVFYNNEVLKDVFGTEHQEDILFGDWVLDYGNRTHLVHEPMTLNLEKLLFASICHQSMFVRLTLLKSEGFDETYKIIADWKRWIQAISGGARVCYLPIVICIFDCSGISFNSDKLLNEEKDRMFNHDFVRFLPLKHSFAMMNSFPYSRVSLYWDRNVMFRYVMKLLLKIFSLFDYK